MANMHSFCTQTLPAKMNYYYFLFHLHFRPRCAASGSELARFIYVHCV